MRLSTLPKTWLVDLDGVLVEHNGHLRGADRLLAGAQAFSKQVAPQDVVVLLSARAEAWQSQSVSLLREAGLRIDRVLFGLPTGERILINDRKPSGLETAFCLNLARDEGLAGLHITRDPAL